MKAAHLKNKQQLTSEQLGQIVASSSMYSRRTLPESAMLESANRSEEVTALILALRDMVEVCGLPSSDADYINAKENAKRILARYA